MSDHSFDLSILDETADEYICEISLNEDERTICSWDADIRKYDICRLCLVLEHYMREELDGASSDVLYRLHDEWNRVSISVIRSCDEHLISFAADDERHTVMADTCISDEEMELLISYLSDPMHYRLT